jgi:hypothetical protein
MRLFLAFALAASLAALAVPALASDAPDGIIETQPQATQHAPPSAPAQDAEARYQALLTQAKASAPESDWQALRFAYADRPSFNPFAQNTAKSDMFKQVEGGDCEAALADAKSLLGADYVDADAHLAAFCEDKAGDAAAAKLDRDIGMGLLQSIVTGAGTSPDSAFVVIDVDEEYALFRARGLKVTNQALVQQKGHTYDAITTLDPQGGATATYYFLIDRVVAAEAAEIKPGALSEGGPPGAAGGAPQ